MKPEAVYGLYDGGWGDLIVPDAYAHPAKYSRKLVQWIMRTGLERDWWQAGSLLIDPFGGVALGGLAAAPLGLQWLGVELEPKFQRIGAGYDCPGFTKQEWVRFHARNRQARNPNSCPKCLAYALPVGQRTIPFVEAHRYVGNIDLHREQWERLGLPVPRLVQGDSRRLASIVREAVGGSVTSPPYASGGHHADQTGAWNTNGRGQGGTRGQAGYGASEGQIGRMSAVTSPPFSSPNTTPVIGQGARNELRKKGRRPEDAQQGQTPGNLAALPIGAVTVDKADSHGVTYYVCQSCIRAKIAEFPLAAVPGGASAVPTPTLAQPSLGDRSLNGGRTRSRLATSMSPTPSTTQRTTTTGREGTIGGVAMLGASSGAQLLSEMDTAAKATVPTKALWLSTICEIESKRGVNGTTPSKISSLSVVRVTDGDMAEPCVFCSASTAGWRLQYVLPADFAQNASDFTSTLQCENGGAPTPNDPNSYWGAVRTIYEQLYELFSPGGHAAIVVKAFVRKGALVDLPQMTLDLLVGIGFEPVTWVNAMLVAESEQGSMMPETVPNHRKERKSFFRRLAEKKGSPAIDAEVVLVVRKPGVGGGTGAVTSPPYAGSHVASGGANIDRSVVGTGVNLVGAKPPGYGHTPGQLGAMKEGHL